MESLKGFAKFVLVIFVILIGFCVAGLLFLTELGKNIHFEGGVHEGSSILGLILPTLLLAACCWAGVKLFSGAWHNKIQPTDAVRGGIDHQIRAILRKNGQMNGAQLAQSVGTNDDTVTEAIRRLLQAQQIRQHVEGGVAVYELASTSTSGVRSATGA